MLRIMHSDYLQILMFEETMLLPQLLIGGNYDSNRSIRLWVFRLLQGIPMEGQCCYGMVVTVHASITLVKPRAYKRRVFFYTPLVKPVVGQCRKLKTNY